jgi:hypothetical protein
MHMCNYNAVYLQSKTRRVLSDRDLLTESFYVHRTAITYIYLLLNYWLLWL